MGVRKLVSGALIATLSLGILTVAAGSAAAINSAEQQFVNLINQERAKKGLSKLVVKNDLVDVARRHSKRMAAEGKIWHNPNLGKEVSGWQVLGENVGMGPSVESLHAAFMNSKPHRENILYSAYNQIGVGNAVDEDGTIYTTHVFAKRSSSTSSSTTTTTKKKSSTKTVSSSTSSPSAATPKASAPVAAPAPKPKAAPKPKPVVPESRTVDLLIRMVGIDADVDPTTGLAAGF